MCKYQIWVMIEHVNRQSSPHCRHSIFIHIGCVIYIDFYGNWLLRNKPATVSCTCFRLQIMWSRGLRSLLTAAAERCCLQSSSTVDQGVWCSSPAVPAGSLRWGRRAIDATLRFPDARADILHGLPCRLMRHHNHLYFPVFSTARMVCGPFAVCRPPCWDVLVSVVPGSGHCPPPLSVAPVSTVTGQTGSHLLSSNHYCAIPRYFPLTVWVCVCVSLSPSLQSDLLSDYYHYSYITTPLLAGGILITI